MEAGLFIMKQVITRLLLNIQTGKEIVGTIFKISERTIESIILQINRNNDIFCDIKTGKRALKSSEAADFAFQDTPVNINIPASIFYKQYFLR